MKYRVAAIAIDGTNTGLIQSWLDSGQLPHLRAVIDQGASGRLLSTKRFRNERCWDIFLSGRDNGSCGSTFVPETYGYFNQSLQREDRYSPFYALGEGYRVCMFDLAATLSPGVNGIQITGWGSELNAAAPLSSPPQLISEIRERFGSDPKLQAAVKVYDHQTREVEYSYVLPSLYDRNAVRHFKDALLTAIERRTAICLDLLGREPWDLFLAMFPESHTANHMLWHLSEPHPLTPPGPLAEPALLAIYQAIDQALGRIDAALPKRGHLLAYTIDHTAQNTMDVPGMALLPELMYRWTFPGTAALAPGNIEQPVPALRTDYHQHWKQEVWNLTTETGRQLLTSPAEQEAAGDPLSWNPANWYRPLWPKMPAFALPSVGDGYVRLNVRGREASGLVEPGDYQRVLNELRELLARTVNPRSGKPLVDRTIATRTSAFDAPDIPPDLIVCWSEDSCADTLDSPDCGRIGPLPYFRSGGHVSHGKVIDNLFAVRGPGIAPGTRTRSGRLEDLPATILQLMGAEPRSPLDGSSLLTHPSQQPVV